MNRWGVISMIGAALALGGMPGETRAAGGTGVNATVTPIPNASQRLVYTDPVHKLFYVVGPRYRGQIPSGLVAAPGATPRELKQQRYQRAYLPGQRPASPQTLPGTATPPATTVPRPGSGSPPGGLTITISPPGSGSTVLKNATIRFGRSPAAAVAPASSPVRHRRPPVGGEIQISCDAGAGIPSLGAGSPAGSPSTLVITVSRSGGSEIQYALENPAISSFSTSSNGNRPRESFSITYTGMKVTRS